MSSVTLVLDLKDKATPALLKAAHAAKSLAGQDKAIAGLQDELRRVAKQAERIRIGPEQFALKEAIDDLDRLEAKLRSTNTLTDSALSTITTRRAQLTSRAADKTGQSLGSMGDRAHEMGESFGDADSALVGFSAVLDLVNPQLGAAVRVAADVGASLEGMIRVVRVGLPIVAALGVAASVGALAYTKWADKTERLKKNLEASSAAMETQRSMVEKIRSAQLDLDVALGAISESEAKIARIRREAFIESLPAVQALTKQITEQQLAVETLRIEQARAAEQAKTMATTDMIGPGGVSMPSAGMGARAQAKDRTADIIKENAALDKLVEKRSELVQQTKDLIALQIKTSEVTEQGNRQTERATTLADEQNAELERMISNMESLSGQLGSLLPAQALTEIEKLDQARTMIADLSAELNRLAGDLSAADTAKFEGLISGYQTALEQATADFMGDPIEVEITPKLSTDEYIKQIKEQDAQAAKSRRQAGLTTAAGAIGAAMSPMSALAAAGPVGAIGASIVGALQMIGERDPETGELAIKARARASVAAVEAGLKALPKVLSNFAPWFVNLLVTRLLPALLKAIIRLPKALLGLVKNVIKNVSGWIFELTTALRDAFRKMLSGLWDRIRGRENSEESSNETRTNAFIRLYQKMNAESAGRSTSTRAANSNARIANSPGLGMNAFRDPLASVVRRQQTVTSESGSASMGGPGGVVVNISGSLVDRNVVDRLGRELNRQFGSFGMATQPIFSS